MSLVKVRYFALLRELAKREEEELAIGPEQTYADLYQTVSARHAFTLPAEMIQVAVNEEFAEMGAPISPGARVVFIPPVAGG